MDTNTIVQMKHDFRAVTGKLVWSQGEIAIFVRICEDTSHMFYFPDQDEYWWAGPAHYVIISK